MVYISEFKIKHTDIRPIGVVLALSPFAWDGLVIECKNNSVLSNTVNRYTSKVVVSAQYKTKVKRQATEIVGDHSPSLPQILVEKSATAR